MGTTMIMTMVTIVATTTIRNRIILRIKNGNDINSNGVNKNNNRNGKDNNNKRKKNNNNNNKI